MERNIFCFSKFFSGEVVAFMTDKTVDFQFDGSNSKLTDPQEKFLKQKAGFETKQFFHVKQIHGRRVVLARRNQRHIPCADASMTNYPGIALTVRTADCVPVFLFDKGSQAICLVHSGWRSAFKGIIPNVALRMRQKYRTNLRNLQVVLGPSIQECCCEVKKRFFKKFPLFVTERNNKFFLNLPGFIKKQFIQEGTLERNIFLSSFCTMCDLRFFSYRRDGLQAGRMLSVIMRKETSNKIKNSCP